MKLTFTHAKNRAEVILPDGRTAWLHSLPSTRPGARTKGARARVVLASGKYLSVAPEALRLAEEAS